MLCSYLLLLCSCLFLTAVYLGTKGLVHSERELLESSVLHPLFNTEAGCFHMFSTVHVCWYYSSTQDNSHLKTTKPNKNTGLDTSDLTNNISSYMYAYRLET